MLILDEPTASLDVHSEHQMFADLARLKEDKTVLLISHRFSTIQMADLIAVLEDGEIVEYGTHDELLESGQNYSKMYAQYVTRYGVPAVNL